MARSTSDIADPAIRAAAAQYERATGRSIVAERPDLDGPMLELVLILRGYPPNAIGRRFPLLLTGATRGGVERQSLAEEVRGLSPSCSNVKVHDHMS